MRIITICPGNVIPLGRQGENQAQQVQFDVTGWEELYGVGVYQLVVKRSGDTTAYPVSVTKSGNRVLWDVSSTDTAIVGAGEAQLHYYVGELIAKTQIHRTLVTAAIAPGTTPPDPYDTWLSDLQELAAQTQQDAADAQDAKTAAEDAQEAAEGSETAAAASATLSESWAVGGTGTRVGEDTDNAKFYAQVAGQAAADNGYMWLYIGSDGGLYFEKTENVPTSFYLEDGGLYTEVSA